MRVDTKRALKCLGKVTLSVLPELLVAVPVIGSVASKCTKAAISEIEKQAKVFQEQMKAAEKEKNEEAKKEAASKYEAFLRKLAEEEGYSEEQLVDMIKTAATEEVKKSAGYSVMPIYASGIIVWAGEYKLSEEMIEVFTEIFNTNIDIEYDDDDLNQIIGNIRGFIEENVDIQEGCIVTDTYINFPFDWFNSGSDIGYKGYMLDGKGTQTILRFIDSLNDVVRLLDENADSPFYRSYQIY